MRIVVADDDPKAACALADFLTFIGHDVQTAFDGRDALAVAQSFRPDMAFLDIEMPFLSGYEVAQQLRAIDSHSGIVLTAVTGLPGENEARAIEAGFHHFFMKPVDLSRLEALVQRHASD
jgi:DNA-binding response OmpR family regulator